MFFAGGAVLAAEQRRGGRAGGAGTGRTGLTGKRRAGGQPGAAVVGVDSCSRSRRFSSLGKLQVKTNTRECVLVQCRRAAGCCEVGVLL